MKLEYPSCGVECAKQIENLIFRRELSPEDTAAVFIEPIQGEGGYIVPPPEFHKEVRKICTDNDVLLAADEVQTGCFRTGPFLAMENFEVRADITCLAKALGAGLPIGAMLADSALWTGLPEFTQTPSEEISFHQLQPLLPLNSLKRKIWKTMSGRWELISGSVSGSFRKISPA